MDKVKSVFEKIGYGFLTILRAIPKGYRAFNTYIEIPLSQVTPNGRFYICGLISLFFMLFSLLGINQVYKIRDENPFEIFPGKGFFIFSLIMMALAFYVIRRGCCAGNRYYRNERIKKGLEVLPENWFRFGNNTPRDPDVIVDFDRFSRELVAKNLTPWQYALSERSWLRKHLEPEGWFLEDFKARYTTRGEKEYTGFDYYFKKGHDYLEITCCRTSVTVAPVRRISYDPDYGFGEYERCNYTEATNKAERMIKSLTKHKEAWE